MFSWSQARTSTQTFRIDVTLGENNFFALTFRKPPRKQLELQEFAFGSRNISIRLRPDMSSKAIRKVLPQFPKKLTESLFKGTQVDTAWVVERNRCFLTARLTATHTRTGATSTMMSPSLEEVSRDLRGIVHVPGLRGNPVRTYNTTAIGAEFPGTFEPYVASVIQHWQATRDDKLQQLGRALEALGLTWRVEARQLDDTNVELRVGRLPHGSTDGAHDMVNIADVGFGVSQTLPVLVALLVAEPGQLVYIEQPEIHLHPRAQRAMAQILADAALRGVRVVVETHSSLLLRGIQTLVAQGSLPKEDVKLHWFTRRPDDGATEILSADLDQHGAFGAWPVDFDDVMLETEQDYLDSVELHGTFE